MKSGISPSRQRASVRWGWLNMCGLALTALFVMNACLSAKVKKGKFEAEVTIGPSGEKKAKIDGPLQPGKCLKIEFVDKDGNTTGSITMSGVPGETTVPPNTTDCKVKEVDCNQNATWCAGPGTPHAPTGGSIKIEPVEVYGFPVTINVTDGGRYKNASYHFRVTPPPGLDPFTLMEPILLGGPGIPVPANVKVISLTQVVPEPQGARLIASATQAFQLFELSWNGQQQYADLATATNAFQYEPGNGWHVVESFIPLSDMNSSPMAINTGIAISKTAGDRLPQTDSVETRNF